MYTEANRSNPDQRSWLAGLSPAPNAIKQILMDHTKATHLYHQMLTEKDPEEQKSLCRKLCMAIEIHATLEEEIFYPALRGIPEDKALIEHSYEEHAAVKARLERIKASLDAGGNSYLEEVHHLMRDVHHHVAEEEGVLLPQAQKQLSPNELDTLGARMAKRRIGLMADLAKAAGKRLRSSTAGRNIAIASAAGLALAVLARYRQAAGYRR